MKALLTLFMAASMFAAIPAAMAQEDLAAPSNDEYSSGVDVQQQEDMNAQDMDSYRWRGGCPWGYERQPSYHWDRRLRRWVFSGWTCRWVGRGGYPGHGRGPGGPGYPGWPGDGGGRGGDHGGHH